VIDHVVIRTRDYGVSKAFHETALAPLGLSAQTEFPGAVGFGREATSKLSFTGAPRL
jgi:hypothetical protein